MTSTVVYRCCWPFAAIVCIAALLLAGCKDGGEESGKPDAAKGAAQAEDHDHAADHDHDTPETFSAGVAMLKEHYQEIKTAFEAGKPEEAHDALHCIGDILEALPDLAVAAGLTEDQAKSVQDATDQLFEAYGKVDAAMHQGEEPDYAAVADTIDQNVAAIEQAVPEQ